jgi:hypothetical protein
MITRENGRTSAFASAPSSPPVREGETRYMAEEEVGDGATFWHECRGESCGDVAAAGSGSGRRFCRKPRFTRHGQ